MAFTREQIQQELGGMGDAHLADTIANPAFDADARRFGVEILLDRKSTQANRPIFGVIVKEINDARAAAAKAAAEAVAEVHPASAD